MVALAKRDWERGLLSASRMFAFGPRSRRLSDWTGFSCFCVLALYIVSNMSAVNVLLMPTLALDFLVAVSFLIREPARETVRTVRARLSAYGGTFVLLGFMQVAQRIYPHWLAQTDSTAFGVAGVLCWLAGSVWSVYSVWYLRHAFSIEPQARRLITSGPYRLARHPVYTGYFVQYGGMWLVFPTIPMTIVLLGWFLLTADRMRNEERVLSRAFPEYTAYRRQVGALGTFPRALGLLSFGRARA
jgi:protein-S-isoprenylcysteine O-methyltransferase Ste14